MFEAFAQVFRRRVRLFERVVSAAGMQGNPSSPKLSGMTESELTALIGADIGASEQTETTLYSDDVTRTLYSQSLMWAEQFNERVGRHYELFGNIHTTRDLGADPHISGVSVLMETDEGYFVYKPRPVKLDYHYNALVRHLAALGLKYPPSSLLIFDFSEYGFIEFVERRNAPVELAVEDFRVVGSILALVYALAGSDFHYQNIIFSKEGIFLIDLEGLLQPSVTTSASIDVDDASVLNTGILPVRVQSGSLFDFDPSVVGSGNYAFDCTRNEALEALLEGFRDGYSLIHASQRSLVLHPDFRALKRTKSRYIAGQTVEYFRALTRHFVASVSGSDFLQNLKSTEGFADPFLEFERRSLASFCIPLFFSSNSTREIENELGEIVPSRIAKNGIENSEFRIHEKMSKSDLRRQSWFARCTFECDALNAGEPFAQTTESPELPDMSELQVDSLRSEILRYAEKVDDYFRLEDSGSGFLVLPVNRDGLWELHGSKAGESDTMLNALTKKLCVELNTNLDLQRVELVSSLDKIVRQLVSSVLQASHRDLEHLGLEPTEFQPGESYFSISAAWGPCAEILGSCADNLVPNLVQCRGFLNSYNNAKSAKAIRYGGIFQCECLLGYFVVPLGVNAYQNYQGICSDTGKRLSERQIVEIASRYVDSTDDELLIDIQENRILGWKQITAPPDRELADFDVDPCCTIASWETLRAEEQEIVTPVRKMLGRFRAWVKLHYEMPDGTYRAGLLPIGNCGEFPSHLID